MRKFYFNGELTAAIGLGRTSISPDEGLGGRRPRIVPPSVGVSGPTTRSSRTAGGAAVSGAAGSFSGLRQSCGGGSGPRPMLLLGSSTSSHPAVVLPMLLGSDASEALWEGRKEVNYERTQVQGRSTGLLRCVLM